MLYLGGNGMFWVTSIAPDRPHLLEVRKMFLSNHPFGLEAPGEAQHAFDDEIGGLWEAQDLPPRTLLGVDTATFAFGRHDDAPAGFRRTEAAADPAYAWVFEGVDEEPIGAYGSNLGSAAGCEMDSVGGWTWPDGKGPVLLARASHPGFALPDRPARTGPPVADVALMLHPGGGAVFSAGSITWGGSLAHNDYENGVARLSENALRRFLDTPRGEPVTS
jgi:N,N-dimethylformamidase